MNTNSRTTNTIYNFISGIGGMLVSIIVQFVVRTVFINTLGKSYLGVGSLFGNILSLLSLAELGVGSAIVFKLYEPIANKDIRRIRVLMKFYRTAYRLIGITIALLGICLIPFLPRLIKDYDQFAALGLNPVFIYLLYLFSTISSYLFFAYRTAIIQADQKGYIVTVVGYLTTFITGIIQIIALLVFRNFTVYIFILIFQAILYNMICAYIAKRMYADVLEKTDEQISKEEVTEILKDCGALFLYKLNAAVVNATDNLVISAFIGLEAVAVYANYYVFYGTICQLYNKVFGAVSHSLGNLHATDNSKHEYDIFKVVMLVASIMGGVACVGLAVCSDEFIKLWIGNSWVLAQPFSILMGMEIYTFSIRGGLARYRQAMGLFRQAKLRPVMGMIVNIVVSVWLVRVYGIIGVVIGTIAADWLVFMWMDPLVVHKYGFKGNYPLAGYFFKFIGNILLTCAICAADFYICSNFVTDWGWFSLIIHAFICAATVCAVFALVYWRTDEGKYLKNAASGILRKIMSRVLRKS